MTDDNQDKAETKQVKIELFDKYRQSYVVQIGCAVEIGESHNGNNKNCAEHDPVKIEKQSAVKAEHGALLLFLVWSPVEGGHGNGFVGKIIFQNLLCNRCRC